MQTVQRVENRLAFRFVIMPVWHCLQALANQFFGEFYSFQESGLIKLGQGGKIRGLPLKKREIGKRRRFSNIVGHTLYQWNRYETDKSTRSLTY